MPTMLRTTQFLQGRMGNKVSSAEELMDHKDEEDIGLLPRDGNTEHFPYVYGNTVQGCPLDWKEQD